MLIYAKSTSWSVGADITFREIAKLFVDKPRINDRLGYTLGIGRAYINSPSSIKGDEVTVFDMGLSFRF